MAGSAESHSSKNDFLASAVWSGRKPCLFFLTMLKNARSAEWHSLPPPFSVALPYMHITTSQASAAMTEVEYDAVMQSDNAEDSAFFISVTFIFKRGLRIWISYLLKPFAEYTSHVIEMKGFKINITYPAYVTVNVNADYHINTLKHFA